MRSIPLTNESLADMHTLHTQDRRLKTNDRQRQQMKNMLPALIEVACTERQKTIMRLYNEGKEPPEIARILGVSRQNIYRMIKTVKDKLKKSKKYF